MTATLYLELRFPRTPDGAVWTAAGYAYPFWGRYLEAFDRLSVVVRVLDVAEAEPGWRRVDGDRVTVVAVPHYIGPAAFLRQAPGVWRAVRDAARRDGVQLLRAGFLSTLAFRSLRRSGRPYAMEITGDPYDVFAPGVVEHPLRPFFRAWFTRQQKQQCASAAAAIYVTERALQARYPCPAFMTGVSDAEIGPNALLTVPRVWPEGAAPRRVVYVGTLDQLYKGPDVLIRALAQTVRGGVDARLVVIGDGRYRAALAQIARDEGVAERVEFRGELPSGAAVRDELDASDLFVLPSLTEGMPRALVEAMARGLPCIGTAVGGVPELLDADALVPPGDAEALADAMRRVLTDPQHMAALSAKNLVAAQRFDEQALHARRLAFYDRIARATRDWEQGHPRAATSLPA